MVVDSQSLDDACNSGRGLLVATHAAERLNDLDRGRLKSLKGSEERRDVQTAENLHRMLLGLCQPVVCLLLIG